VGVLIQKLQKIWSNDSTIKFYQGILNSGKSDNYKVGVQAIKNWIINLIMPYHFDRAYKFFFGIFIWKSVH